MSIWSANAFRWGYTWTKMFLHGRGLVMPGRGGAPTGATAAPADGGDDAAPGRVQAPLDPGLEAGFDPVITLDDATGDPRT
jgi:hypothetical protein